MRRADMTIEEALEELKAELLDWNYKVNRVSTKGKALEIAIRCMEILPKAREEIEASMESIIGKYDSSVPKHDMPSMKIARNEARKECLDIIDRHLKEVGG